jgi:CRP-like cAMP-binding protein
MIIEQSDLFQGMNREFVKSIMDITTKDSFEAGDLIFREGDKATHFYFLLKGRVKLTTGETARMVHTVDCGGEVFGWSSIVGRDVYSASAECVAPTKLLKCDQKELQNVLEKDLPHGFVFLKRLASVVGERLINSYKSLLLSLPSEAQRTYGSSATLQQRGDEAREEAR